ncbi:class I adenylate-forming enzyme family protein [Actinomadura nitritigenes]|uniref:class I adenylate-forming enzyme family protein n=1 Tax=Actinomadura nitritigenes TaxID=134602 RepID=UPI003D948E84
MNINDLVRYWGRTRPEHDAIVFGGTVLSWGEVDAASDALARGLAARGVGKGDRVGLLMTNAPLLAQLMLATVKLGAICVPLNFRLLAGELLPMLRDAAPSVVVADGGLAHLLEPGQAELGFEVFSAGGTDLPSAELLHVTAGPVPEVAVADDDPAFICYTSGTTGVQKGALLTHRSILSVGQAAAVMHGLSWRDRVMACAPLVYTGSGISVFLQFVVYPGATLVLLADFDPEIGLDVMERERVTCTTMVPVIWERIAAVPGFTSRRLADFTFAGAGGAPVSADLLETYRSRGIPLTQVYGLTEASGLAASMRYQDAVTRPGYAGLPLVGTDIRIGDPEGRTLAPGETGEILVRGPHVMDGYWQRPGETAESMHGGWLRSGDLGFQDDAGFLKLVDRRKDLVISGGLNVYPAELERALTGVDGVLDLAVIGVPDDRWGEVPLIVFHTRKDPAEAVAELSALARDNLARFKQPKHAVALPEPLPRTFSGKLAKNVLRERIKKTPDDALPLDR